ncbi:hypothetical protein ACFQZ2_12485 [Streptomonospora algeriensis]|uniref:Uncharacterized protein n=1 Tax=Streptomonospora algeriensis TaxID=995084 RepID=A0ABW3BHD6_9ACTN
MIDTIGPIRTAPTRPQQPLPTRRRYRPRHAASPRIRPYVLVRQQRGGLFYSDVFAAHYGGVR